MLCRHRMQDSMDKAVKNCSGFSDVRDKAAKNPGLEEEWLKSTVDIKHQIEERMQRLKLHDKLFQVGFKFSEQT